MEGDSLSKCLDYLGYSLEMIQYRRDINQKLDEIHNGKPFTMEAVSAGSKAEGTALYFESDIDRLYVVKDVRCLETVGEDSASFIFQLDYSNCSSGYCRLKFTRGVETSKSAQHVLPFIDTATGYLTNSVSFFSEFSNIVDVHGDLVKKRDKKGPSASYSNNFVDYNFVKGLVCNCSTLTDRWVQRPRQHEWPDRKMIEDVSKLEAHVVPVACKNSNFPLFEWRICFTKAEIFLMRSLNETESKVFVLLKLIAKFVLRPICGEMTSYIMKNVIFWMKENNEPEMFLKNNLLEGLIYGLNFLKDCIQAKRFESYMIAERNLFEGRLNDGESLELTLMIDQLLQEKSGMLNRVGKIREAFRQIEISPELFQKQCETRNEIEIMLYRKNIIFREIDTPDADRSIEEFQATLKNDEQSKHLTKQLHSLVFPDRRENSLSDVNFEDTFKLRLRQILS